MTLCARLSAACCLSLALVLPATAAVSPGITTSGVNAPYNGIGELFLSVFDPVAKISYTLDLGITQNEFQIIGTADAGLQRFWEVNDAQWNTFMLQVDAAQLRWSVLAIDQTGGTAVGGVRLFMTVRQGDETVLIDTTRLDPANPNRPTGFSTMTNQNFTNGMGSTQAGTFFNALNSTGTHGQQSVAPIFADNGSSVNADSDTGNAYYGDGGVGLTPTLNGRAPFNMSNEVGKSSWFYYLTRSGPVQSDTVLVDEFDNLSADGYWGFTFVDAVANPLSPYAGKYLLSYTLAPAIVTAQQREFAASIGRTERSGGFGSVQRLGAATVGGEAPAAWQTQRLGGLTALAPLAVSPVPEPGALLLMMLGLAGVVHAARRRC